MRWLYRVAVALYCLGFGVAIGLCLLLAYAYCTQPERHYGLAVVLCVLVLICTYGLYHDMKDS